MTKFLLIFFTVLLQFSFLYAQRKYYNYSSFQERSIELVSTGDDDCAVKFIFDNGVLGKTEYIPIACEKTKTSLDFSFDPALEMAKTSLEFSAKIFNGDYYGIGLEGQEEDFNLKFVFVGGSSSFLISWPSRGLSPTNFSANKERNPKSFAALQLLNFQFIAAAGSIPVDFHIENFYFSDADKIRLHIKGEFDPIETMTGELELEFSGAFTAKTKVKVGPIP